MRVGKPPAVVGYEGRGATQWAVECQQISGCIASIKTILGSPAEAKVEPAGDGPGIERRGQNRVGTGATGAIEAGKRSINIEAPAGHASRALLEIRIAQVRLQNQSTRGRTRVVAEGGREPRRRTVGRVAGINLVQVYGLKNRGCDSRCSQCKQSNRRSRHQSENRLLFHTLSLGTLFIRLAPTRPEHIACQFTSMCFKRSYLNSDGART